MHDRSGVGGLYTNPTVVKSKTIEPPQKPDFAQYMEQGTISENTLKMKPLKCRKRHAPHKRGSVGGKRVKKSVGKKGKKRTQTKKKVKSPKRKIRTKVKDRF